MICVLHQGTGVVLQISREIANPIKNELKARIDHMEESYDYV